MTVKEQLTVSRGRGQGRPQRGMWKVLRETEHSATGGLPGGTAVSTH